MKRIVPKQHAVRELPHYLVDYLRDEVLTTLQGCAFMTVDELLQKMPQFRWMDIFSVIGKLRQEGRLGLQEKEGRIRIFPLDTQEQCLGSSPFLL